MGKPYFVPPVAVRRQCGLHQRRCRLCVRTGGEAGAGGQGKGIIVGERGPFRHPSDLQGNLATVVEGVRCLARCGTIASQMVTDTQCPKVLR